LIHRVSLPPGVNVTILAGSVVIKTIGVVLVPKDNGAY